MRHASRQTVLRLSLLYCGVGALATTVCLGLLLQNWIVGPAFLVTFVPFYLLRVPSEERMMLDVFGDQYRDYRKRTGRILPKFR